MRLPLAFLPEARGDIDTIYVDYERQSSGLGEQFMNSLHVLFEQMSDNPELYARIFRDVRAAPVRRFPYVVFFRKDEQRLLVVAVQHGRRSSRPWLGRL